MRTRLCLYVVGGAPPAIAAAHGDYHQWFQRLLAVHDVEVTVADGRARYAGNLDNYDGFVVTGSSASMTRPEPWMELAVELVRRCYQHDVPLLGVCFGHQVIGAAFGGSVVPNPRGWHVGTREVAAVPGAEADPLMDGLGSTFAVNVCHQDIIDADTLAPQNGVHVIAHTERAHAAVIAAGRAVRGVQFHPEFDGAVMRAYLRRHHDAIAAQAGEELGEQPAGIAARVADCPAAETLFHNFVRHFVLTRRARP